MTPSTPVPGPSSVSSAELPSTAPGTEGAAGQPWTRDRRLAVHEAAHVVTAHLLRGVVTGPVTIEPSVFGTIEGCAYVRPRGRLSGEMAGIPWMLPLLPTKSRRWLEASVMISLAGGCAEDAYRPPSSGYVAPSADEAATKDFIEKTFDEAFRPLTDAERRRLWLAKATRPELVDDETAAYDDTQLLVGKGLLPAYLNLLREATRCLVSTPDFAAGLERLVPPLLKERTLSPRTTRLLLKGEDA